MSRASSDILDILHGMLAGALKEELERAVEAARQPQFLEETNEDGSFKKNPAYAPINPQLIDKAMKFLKDNGIDAPASNRPMNDLVATLGALDLDEEAATINRMN